MHSDWLIISDKFHLENIPELNKIYQSDYFTVYAQGKNIFTCSNSSLKYIIIDGYVLPRQRYFHKYSGFTQYKLIENLYEKYRERFIDFIKGNFVIVIEGEEGFKIFNDHFGIKKVFYYQLGNKFVFSNSAKLATQFISKREIDITTIIAKSLLNKEILGKTVIKNLKFLTPASKVEFIDGELKFSKYWQSSELLASEKQNYDFHFFANFISDSLKQYSEYLKPNYTTISLTGGKDSRTLLAALLKNGIKPFGFTYGDPNSKDAIFAKKIANKLDLNYKIFTPNITSEWFESFAKKIIEIDNPTINIHRSHRLYAFEQLKKNFGENTSYYAGYMGGEFLMGIYCDNLIFTKFLTDFWETGIQENPRKYFSLNFINRNIINEDDLINEYSLLKSFDSSLSKKIKQFYSFFEIGIPHHTQDIFLSSTQMNYPIPFFIDIDFLELLFQSNFSFFNRDNKTKNLLERYKLYEFNLNIQHILFPDLDEFPFAKKGVYNTKDFLRGKYYWSFIKTLKYFTQYETYPASFNYNLDYIKFLRKWLFIILDDKNSIINDMYDVSKSLTTLEASKNLTEEKYLHRYSNIVMHYMQSKYYSL